MQRLFSLLALLLVASTSYAQLNMVLRDQLNFTSNLNDIWGYVSPSGTEYALVGRVDGVSIVSLADPDNVVEVASIPGEQSLWRDLKSYGEYAYIVADESGTTEGLTIIDLTDIDNGNISFTHNNYDVGFGEVLNTAHNIYIDEAKGLAFLAGSNVVTGCMVFDLNSNPGQAVYLTSVGNRYAHDVYVNENYLYNSGLGSGLRIWDISDVMNPVLLGVENTPFNFTHNAWSTPDNNLVFTTDERGNASVAAYDISDPSDPQLLDEYRPLYSINQGVIPHNTHVLNEYLFTSYYTDGITIVDASDPTNLIEVANWDTWSGGPGGFNGCWGAYPFLPSGLILATDQTSGLFVLEPNLLRGARLEGTVMDETNGGALNGVSVEINAPQLNIADTDAAGDYATGIANAGTYQVIFSKPNYIPVIVDVDLINGQTITLDTSLREAAVFPFVGNVIEEVTANAVPEAQIYLESVGGFNLDIVLDADELGVADFTEVTEGTYNIYVGKWGYQEILAENVTIDEAQNLIFELPFGYQDGFQLDQGWTILSEASSGFWSRDLPIGTTSGDCFANPGLDAEGDLGNFAFMTGNGGGGVGTDDIDDGTVTLFSPIFDLSLYQAASVVLHYQYWFANFGGNGSPNDQMSVTISNGQTSIELANYDEDVSCDEWFSEDFQLADFIELTDQMQLIVVATDLNGGHVSEGGLDDFLITGELLTSTENLALVGLEVNLSPNPSDADFQLNYRLPSAPTGELRMEVLDILGRQLTTQRLAPFANGVLRFGQELAPGTYLVRMLQNGQQIYSTKVIKF
ncbi:MAG: choice-of-anchor B family protein [Bacteroidota bacterium]